MTEKYTEKENVFCYIIHTEIENKKEQGKLRV